VFRSALTGEAAPCATPSSLLILCLRTAIDAAPPPTANSPYCRQRAVCPAWQFELKYDGFRALCYLEPRRNRFISRTGNILSRFDALADQTASEIVGFDEAILDGEVIAPDATGRPQFYDLLKHACRPAYVVFDLLWLSGTDLRSWPLRHRLQALEGILPEGSRVISPPVSVHGRGRQLFDLVQTHDLEGIVAKRLTDQYGPGTKWLKIKNPEYSQKDGRWELFNGRG
jgi:bifunctional non-homologous end joining protein LigD